jgi:hypothetical protein
VHQSGKLSRIQKDFNNSSLPGWFEAVIDIACELTAYRFASILTPKIKKVL